MTSFYSEEELTSLGLGRYGKNVLLSRKVSLYAPERMEIGDHVRIDDFCILSGSIKLGNYIHIAAYCGLFGSQEIVLEDYCGLSSRVSIYTVSEDYLGNGLTNPTIPLKYRRPVQDRVVLKKHALVGCGAVILPGVTIDVGAAIGALSLVSSSCKPWTIYGGIPARVKKNRRKDLLLKYQAALEKE